MKVLDIIVEMAAPKGIKVIPLKDFLAQSVDQGVGEALKLDSPHTRVPDPEAADYFKRVKADQMYRATKDKKKPARAAAAQKDLDAWTDRPEKRTQKELKRDYYTKPQVHGSSIKFIAGGHEIDVDSVKKVITTRPTKFLKQNKKMEHTGNVVEVYYNVGLPALKGLAVDEETGEFVYVDTCPGAGECQVVCYAKKGRYVMFKPSWENQSRILNYLLNDPDGFASALSQEIAAVEAKNDKKGYKTNIRWHDAGDFFSPAYIDVAANVAKRFPNIKFYAYTKMGQAMTSSMPPNFIWNWSEGAKSQERKVIRIHQEKNPTWQKKHSVIVPRDMFSQLTTYKKDPNDPEGEGKLDWHTPEVWEKFKGILATNYKIKPETIISYDQLTKIPPGNKPLYNVVIKPGEGDISANRHDVIGTYLLQH